MFKATNQTRQLTSQELQQLTNIQNQTEGITVLIFDNTKPQQKAYIASCPNHGDLIVHTHAGKLDKVTNHDECKIPK